MKSLKKSGYILLLTMIILSSISLLLLTIIRQSSIYFNLNRSFYDLYNEKKYILDAIVIVKDLLLAKDKKSEESKKEDQEKNPNKRFFDFFKFYWLYCNRWLEYSIVNDLHNVDVNMKIYITCHDGKIPLLHPLIVFKNEINKNNNSNYGNAAKQEKNDDLSDKILKHNVDLNNFFSALEKIYKQENSILNSLLSIGEDGKNVREKGDFIKTFQGYIRSALYLPSQLCDIYRFSDKNIDFKSLYKKVYAYGVSSDKKNKPSSLSDFFSVNNVLLYPLFYSPVVISALSNKEIQLTDEIRNKIVQDGINFIGQKDTIAHEKFWHDVIEKNLKVPYPKDFFNNNEIKKIVSGKVGYPQFIEVILQITVSERDLFVLINFEKNVKYDKTNKKEHSQNREYVVTSIQVFPIEK